MSQVKDMLQRYKEIRARLRNPPNAVPDTGINLSRNATPPIEPEEPIPPKPSLKDEKPKPRKEPLIKGLTFNSTIEITAEEFDVTAKDLLDNRRTKKIAEARQVAMYIATDRQGRGLSWVARYMNRDHTTVLYARDKIRDLISTDSALKTRIDNLENKIALFSATAFSPQCESYLEAQPEGDVPCAAISEVD